MAPKVPLGAASGGPPDGRRQNREKLSQRKTKRRSKKQESAADTQVRAKKRASRQTKRSRRRRDREEREEEKLKEEAKNRFHTMQIRGFVVGQAHDEIKATEKREGWEGMGNVWASMQGNHVIKWSWAPPHYKAGGQFGSIKEVENWTCNPPDVWNKLLEKKRDADALTAAEASSHPDRSMSRIEAGLAAAFPPVRKVALSFAAHAGWCPPLSDEARWPHESQARGKEIFKALQDKYDAEAFPSPEALALGARYLLVMWKRCPAWFTEDEAYIDCFLLNMQQWALTPNLGRARRTKALRLIRIPEISHLNELMDQHFFGQCTATDNMGGVVTRKQLEDAANISPITWKVLEVDRKKMENGIYPEEVPKAAGPQFKTPTSFFKREENFPDWLDWFYGNSSTQPDFPDSIGPFNEYRGPVMPDRNQRRALASLRRAADELSEHTANPLVVMVWRDFMIPAAEAGDGELVDEYLDELTEMVSGGLPDDLYRDGDDERKW